MSDLKTLRELADLASQTSAPPEPELSVSNGDYVSAGQRSPRPRVAELLGMVMALSARTRRIARQPVEIDLDVFTPDGRRAVRMNLGA